jgi:hypothetical protein
MKSDDITLNIQEIANNLASNYFYKTKYPIVDLQHSSDKDVNIYVDINISICKSVQTFAPFSSSSSSSERKSAADIPYEGPALFSDVNKNNNKNKIMLILTVMIIKVMKNTG